MLKYDFCPIILLLVLNKLKKIRIHLPSSSSTRDKSLVFKVIITAYFKTEQMCQTRNFLKLQQWSFPRTDQGQYVQLKACFPLWDFLWKFYIFSNEETCVSSVVYKTCDTKFNIFSHGFLFKYYVTVTCLFVWCFVLTTKATSPAIRIFCNFSNPYCYEEFEYPTYEWYRIFPGNINKS